MADDDELPASIRKAAEWIAEGLADLAHATEVGRAGSGTSEITAALNSIARALEENARARHLQVEAIDQLAQELREAFKK